MFYPGARVHRDAYIATWAQIVAATDTLVLIPRMPLNLAVFGQNQAASLMAAYPDIDTWWVGGHSLGGAMAASFAGDQPPGDLTVLSVSGSRDGLSTPTDIVERRPLLPDDAIMVEVEGMNHAQFGRYGPQRGDLPATINDDEATSRLLEAHLPVLADLDG